MSQQAETINRVFDPDTYVDLSPEEHRAVIQALCALGAHSGHVPMRLRTAALMPILRTSTTPKIVEFVTHVIGLSDVESKAVLNTPPSTAVAPVVDVAGEKTDVSARADDSPPPFDVKDVNKFFYYVSIVTELKQARLTQHILSLSTSVQQMFRSLSPKSDSISEVARKIAKKHHNNAAALKKNRGLTVEQARTQLAERTSSAAIDDFFGNVLDAMHDDNVHQKSKLK